MGVSWVPCVGGSVDGEASGFAEAEGRAEDMFAVKTGGSEAMTGGTSVGDRRRKPC